LDWRTCSPRRFRRRSSTPRARKAEVLGAGKRGKVRIKKDCLRGLNSEDQPTPLTATRRRSRDFVRELRSVISVEGSDKMKPASRRSGNVLRGQLQKPNQNRKPAMKAKRVRFDSLVARYYCTVYNFASRLTDDPLEAVLLTHDAFNSTRKQLRNRRDELERVTILLNAVIRADLAAA
jgi:hypothetical protein